MYNYGQGYTVGGGMGNLGAYTGLIGGINTMMQGISPDQQAGQVMPGMNMFGMAGQIAQNPYQNLGLVGQVVGGFQGTAGGNVGGLSQDQYPARNSGFLNKKVM